MPNSIRTPPATGTPTVSPREHEQVLDVFLRAVNGDDPAALSAALTQLEALARDDKSLVQSALTLLDTSQLARVTTALKRQPQAVLGSMVKSLADGTATPIVSMLTGNTFVKQVDTANAAIRQGDSKAEHAALVAALGSALSMSPESIATALRPSVTEKLNDDGSTHRWYELTDLFTTREVGALSAQQVKTFVDTVSSLADSRVSQVSYALARMADLAAANRDLTSMNVTQQLLAALASSARSAELNIVAGIATADYQLAVGNAKAAAKTFKVSAGSATSLSHDGAKTLATRAVLGQASALATLATSGTHDQRSDAAARLRVLRQMSVSDGSLLSKDEQARLGLLEMSAFLSANQSEAAQSTLNFLKAGFANDAEVPWLKSALTDFEQAAQKGGLSAFVQVALREANSDSIGENLAASAIGSLGGAATGAAIGSAFFGVGAIPGALIGALLGGGATTAALKTRNIIRGADEISQAGRTGWSALGWKDAAMDSLSLGLSVAAMAAPVRGVTSVGAAGVSALTGMGSMAVKTEAAALMTGLSARVEEAWLRTVGREGFQKLAASEVERMAKEMLVREIAKQTALFGGASMSAITLGALVTPFALQLREIEQSSATPEQKAEARKELLKRASQALVTTALTAAPLILLGQVANQPAAPTTEISDALAELAPNPSEIRAVSPQRFQAYLARRSETIAATEGAALARVNAIRERGIAAFDPLTGMILVNTEALATKSALAVVKHEVTHQRLHSLSVAQRDAIERTVTSHPSWNSIKTRFVSSNQRLAKATDAVVIDELISAAHGEPSSALAKSMQPLFETDAFKRAGLSKSPEIDLAELKRTGAVTLSNKTYFNRSGETEPVPFTEADGPDISANWSRLNETQHIVLRNVDAEAKRLSESATAKLNERAKRLGYTEAEVNQALEHIKTRAQVTVNFAPDKRTAAGTPVIDAFISQGRYVNQFESKISSGTLAPTAGSARDGWERTIFSGKYHTHDLIPEERPKYGAFNPDLRPIGGASHYGNSFFVLKEGTKNRMTFTPANSSGMRAENVGTAEHFKHVLADAQLSDQRFKAILDTALGKPAAPAMHSSWEYIELQLHGPFELAKDVERIVANVTYKTNAAYLTKLRQLANQLKVPLQWTDGKMLVDDVRP